MPTIGSLQPNYWKCVGDSGVSQTKTVPLDDSDESQVEHNPVAEEVNDALPGRLDDVHHYKVHLCMEKLLCAKGDTIQIGSDLIESIDLSAEYGVEAEVPSQAVPGIKDQVDVILRRCFEVSEPNATNYGLAAQNYYPLWGGNLLAGTAASASGLTDWISLVAGQGRFGDGILTHEGFISASVANRRELLVCRNYLNARWAIRALEELERLTLATGTTDYSELFVDAGKTLQDLANSTYKTFAGRLAGECALRRNVWAEWRDVGVGGLNAANSGCAIAAGIIKEGADITTLVGAAKEFVQVVPLLSASLGIVSGTMSIAQGILERNDATKDMEALLAAERLDKEVYAQYGVECPEFSNLFWHRQQTRDLQSATALMLQFNGSIRATNGGIGIGASATAIGLLAAGGAAVFGAATMGVAAIIGGVATVGYLLWINIRSTIAQHVQKRYDKVLRTINANNQENLQGIPGLSTDNRRPSIGKISAALSKNIANPDTRDRTKKMLVDLGIPKSIVDSADVDGGKRLAGFLIIPVTKADALRNLYARSKATAQDKLGAVQEWLADPELKDVLKIAEKTHKVKPGWSNYLASGDNMGDLCKSTLTLERIAKHWSDPKLKTHMMSLRTVKNVPLETAQDAWGLLQERRKGTETREKASATVAAWINGMKVDSIKNCLNSSKNDPLTLACKMTLKVDFGIDQTCDDIKKALRGHLGKTALGVDTIESFMAVYKASSEQDIGELGTQTLQPFLVRTFDAMHEDERNDFRAMLGVEGEGTLLQIDTKKWDAVLGKIHKFLRVSEKLRGQTLTKVIASLHEYPTDGSIPKEVARIAAIRELRVRCSSVDETDVRHTLALAKVLSREKLHERAFGAGEGGGVLGFGGYRLNEKGKIVRELVERCLGQGSPINSFSAAMVKQLRAKHDDSGEYVDALTHWTKKLIGEVGKLDETAVSKLADMLDLYRTPGKLEKALESSDSDVPAKTCLKNRLTVAKEELEKTAAVLNDPKTKMGFDSSSFVTQLTEFFSLQKLAKKYGKADQDLKLPFEVARRLEVYRAALEWGNKTARAKNITAIQWELHNLKTGELAANPFWSAKFLNSEPSRVKDELERMRARYHWVKENSYKSFVKEVNELDAMPTSRLYRAIMKNDRAGMHWIFNQCALYGLKEPASINWDNLKNAGKKGSTDLLKALVTMLEAEFVKQASPQTGQIDV